MDRKEILSVLELPVETTDIQINKKLEEKIQQYEALSNDSPSAFLRRLNAQHVLKLMTIKKELLVILKQPVPEIKEEIKNDPGSAPANVLTMPVIIPSSLRKLEKKETKTSEPEIKPPPAYLVRHTESKTVKSFPLSEGKNYIGRKPHATLNNLIALEDDDFVSRIHAMIYVDGQNEANNYIEDSVVSNEGKISKNGVFINGNVKRIMSKTILKDNDVIQVGETKLIFRLNLNGLERILEETEDRSYMHTVVIRL
ncbi:MAG: FHA domain-containing protein [Ferruginibacter sp.]